MPWHTGYLDVVESTYHEYSISPSNTCCSMYKGQARRNDSRGPAHAWMHPGPQKPARREPGAAVGRWTAAPAAGLRLSGTSWRCQCVRLSLQAQRPAAGLPAQHLRGHEDDSSSAIPQADGVTDEEAAFTVMRRRRRWRRRRLVGRRRGYAQVLCAAYVRCVRQRCDFVRAARSTHSGCTCSVPGPFIRRLHPLRSCCYAGC